MENTTEITLTSGGRAWAWRELLWSDDLRRWHFIEAATPEKTLERVRAQRLRERDIRDGIQPGPDAPIVLTEDDIREAADYANEVRCRELEVCLARWEGVRDPRTGEDLPLTMDGLRRLGKRDGDELLRGARAALAEAAPDPNAGGDRSPNASSTATERSIPSGTRRSRRRGS